MCLLSTWGFPARVRISQASFLFLSGSFSLQPFIFPPCGQTASEACIVSVFVGHFTSIVFYFPILSSNCIRNILMIAVAVLYCKFLSIEQINILIYYFLAKGENIFIEYRKHKVYVSGFVFFLLLFKCIVQTLFSLKKKNRNTF